MAYELPDIPVRAKLFNYRIDHKKYAAYEVSTVELAQEQSLNIDFDMGMPLDLIDRDIYTADGITEQLESLKLKYLDEKDKFILSDKDTFEAPVKKLTAEGTIPMKLPARYRMVQREEKWGRDTKSSSIMPSREFEGVTDIIMTTTDKDKKAELHDRALQQVEKKFADSKNVVPGGPKGL
jgi:hypothetical protein